jgi:hypothetical protein
MVTIDFFIHPENNKEHRIMNKGMVNQRIRQYSLLSPHRLFTFQNIKTQCTLYLI